MPQFDPNVFAPQIIWLAISFVVLYFLMSRVALPKVSEVLARRKDRIEGNLERAQALKADAEATAEAYDQAMVDARQNAQGVIAEARNKLGADADARHADLNERLTAEIGSAEGRIADATNAAMADVRNLALEVAATATERLTGDAPDDKAVGKAVDSVLKERD
ncbi:MAG: F0F1 ATP synthase subunit B' [Rhodospirillales bacterium]|nr:F0F1 ATP synthase subunit B' [Rhodospirillales bacterium]